MDAEVRVTPDGSVYGRLTGEVTIREKRPKIKKVFAFEIRDLDLLNPGSKTIYWTFYDNGRPILGNASGGPTAEDPGLAPEKRVIFHILSACLGRVLDVMADVWEKMGFADGELTSSEGEDPKAVTWMVLSLVGITDHLQLKQSELEAYCDLAKLYSLLR